MDWLQVVGLVVDMAGAFVVGWPVMAMTDEDARGIGLATISAKGDLEEDLRMPTVRALTKQRTYAKVGIGLLFVGFLLQAISRIG